MVVANETMEHNIIILQEGEVPFFEDFTKKHGISWAYEDKKNHILPLSKAYVGYITTPERVIVLKPKYHEIGFEHIVRMYLYVYGYRPTDSPAILDVSDSESSVDIADLFLWNLRRNVQEGLIRTYARKDIKTDSIIGKVNYTKTYMDSCLMKRKSVTTTVSSLTMDNDCNALILTALRKLQHVSKYSSSATALSMYFDGARDKVTNGSAILEKIYFNSNTMRYRRTLIYAAMIVDQLSYSDKGSSVGTDSFLINFDRLFEDFVAKILKSIPEKKEFTTWSVKQPFAKTLSVTGVEDERLYKPDLLYRYMAEDEKHDYMPSSYAVLDVKNKAYGQFKNADVYQILTYLKLLHCKKALLLYPSFQRRLPETLFLNADIFSPATISSCFVNIADQSGEAFLKSIHWFADVVVKTILDIPL